MTATTDRPGVTDVGTLDPEQVEQLYRRHLHASKLDEQRSWGLDVVMGRREGARFEDARTGRWLWNCHCNGSTFSFGHRNPRIVEAVQHALDTVDVGNHHLLSPWRAVAASRLSGLCGGRLPGVVFTASGSEATDVAIKVARAATGRRRVVTATWAWHGTTGLAVAAAGAWFAGMFGLDDPDFTQVPWNDVEALATGIDEQTALVLLEAIPATAGFPMPAEGYLQAVEARCREVGAVFAVDEVQTGLGRTGRVWSYEHDAVTPDLVTVGKGLSGGVYPIAAVLLNDALFERYCSVPAANVSTFGGAEPACAAVIAVCDLLDEPGFLENVRARAEQFREGLVDLPVELRQRGLVMALGVEPPDNGKALWRRLLAEGVFGFPASFAPQLVQYKPPLVLTEADTAEIVAATRQAVLAGTP